MESKFWPIVAVVLFVLLIASVFTRGFGLTRIMIQPPSWNVAEDARDFVNQKLLSQGSASASIIYSEKLSNSLYKTRLKIKKGDQNREIETYISRDRKLFFPQAFKLDLSGSKTQKPQSQSQSQSNTDTPKIDTKKETPKVELFVMSYCPYGTQMEKAILPVLNTLGDKINFELEFCDYAMHDKKELEENLNQYCIQKQSNKLNEYLGCFLESGNSDKCVAQANVNKENLKSCVNTTDKKYNVMENYKDKSTWKGDYPTFNANKEAVKEYGIQGSPTMVINGQTVKNAPRNPDALLQTICAGFKDKPQECSKSLSTEASAPGIGTTGGSGSSGGSCQ